MENALMGLPDFALGEQPIQVERTEFRPLFDGQKKLEMMSDIVIDAPIVRQPITGTSLHPRQSGVGAPPQKVLEEPAAEISLEKHQGIIEDLKKRREEDLDRLRKTHQNDVMRQIELFESSLFEDISKQLESKVAEALAPLVEKCVSRNSLDAIVKEIHSIAGKEALVSLHLSGPLSLTSAVKEKLSDSQFNIEVEELDSVELVACLNDKLISTRLKEWSCRIETAIS